MQPKEWHHTQWAGSFYGNNNQDNPPQTHPWVNLIWGILHLWLPSQVTLSCAGLTVKANCDTPLSGEFQNEIIISMYWNIFKMYVYWKNSSVLCPKIGVNGELIIEWRWADFFKLYVQNIPGKIARKQKQFLLPWWSPDSWRLWWKNGLILL